MAPDDISDKLFESMVSSGGRTPASQELRDAVLVRTTRTIRNRRRMQRAALAVTLVGCYLGGAATVSLWPANGSVDGSGAGSPVGFAQTGEGATKPDVRTVVRPEDDQIADGSVASAANRLTPYERLCRSGDQQLKQYDDIPAAMRSYKKALLLASADQRGIAPDRDTWLLMALKQSIN